jgi:hypothetical protein
MSPSPENGLAESSKTADGVGGVVGNELGQELRQETSNELRAVLGPRGGQSRADLVDGFDESVLDVDGEEFVLTPLGNDLAQRAERASLGAETSLSQELADGGAELEVRADGLRAVVVQEGQDVLDTDLSKSLALRGVGGEQSGAELVDHLVDLSDGAVRLQVELNEEHGALALSAEVLIAALEGSAQELSQTGGRRADTELVAGNSGGDLVEDVGDQLIGVRANDLSASRANGGGDNVADVLEVSLDLLSVTVNFLFNKTNNEVAAFAETQHLGFLLNTNGADVVTAGKSGGEHEQQNDANVLVHVGNMKE